MDMVKIVCPKCNAEAKVSFVDGNYSGPRRCWKCHEYFTIRIENNRVVSSEPLSAEEYERQQAAKKAAEKGGGGLQFSTRAEPQRQSAPEQPSLFQREADQSHGGLEFSKPAKMESPQQPMSRAVPPQEKELDIFQQLTGKSKGNKNTQPEAPRAAPKQEFIRPAAYEAPQAKTPPRQPDTLKQGEVFPPARFNTFVPQEDIKIDPEKPKKEKKHPEMYNPFIPPQT